MQKILALYYPLTQKSSSFHCSFCPKTCRKFFSFKMCPVSELEENIFNYGQNFFLDKIVLFFGFFAKSYLDAESEKKKKKKSWSIIGRCSVSIFEMLFFLFRQLYDYANKILLLEFFENILHFINIWFNLPKNELRILLSSRKLPFKTKKKDFGSNCRSENRYKNKNKQFFVKKKFYLSFLSFIIYLFILKFL